MKLLILLESFQWVEIRLNIVQISRWRNFTHNFFFFVIKLSFLFYRLQTLNINFERFNRKQKHY